MLMGHWGASIDGSISLPSTQPYLLGPEVPYWGDGGVASTRVKDPLTMAIYGDRWFKVGNALPAAATD